MGRYQQVAAPDFPRVGDGDGAAAAGNARGRERQPVLQAEDAGDAARRRRGFRSDEPEARIRE